MSTDADLLAGPRETWWRDFLVSEITFLDEDVRELVDGYDWLGTGGDSRWANKQAKEWQNKLNERIAALLARLEQIEQKDTTP